LVGTGTDDEPSLGVTRDRNGLTLQGAQRGGRSQDDEAFSVRHHGIRPRWAPTFGRLDATEAALWRTLGLTAAEAARLARKGASAADTIKEWWRAGIPFDEVADWIGAGLTAKEAADQRARGITAEQAAALRALRDQDADD